MELFWDKDKKLKPYRELGRRIHRFCHCGCGTIMIIRPSNPKLYLNVSHAHLARHNKKGVYEEIS